jgi:hypothetical protein
MTTDSHPCQRPDKFFKKHFVARLLSALVIFLCLPDGARAQNILAWDFFGEGSTTNTTSVADVYDSGLDSTNVLSRGPGASWSTGANSFRTTGFQNNGIATTNTDYFQFLVSATNGKLVSLNSITARFNGTTSFVTNNSNAGVTNQFAYSTNGTDFTLIAAPSVVTGTNNGTNWNMTATLSNIAALQNLAPSTTATFRFYASGQTTTGGWGFNSRTNGVYGLEVAGVVVEDVPVSAPTAPVISAPSAISTTGFSANWQASSGATKYYLDVATDNAFSSFVTGYNNLDVGGATSQAVTGLSPATIYYYRVRASNSVGTSANSETQVALTASLTAPTIAVSPTSLTNLSYIGSGPSAAQSVSVTASNLTGAPGSLTVAGSSSYEVSTTASNSGFGTSASIAYSSATLSATDLWVRLKAGLAAGNYNGETISVSGGGAASAATVSVSGSVTVPSISVTTTNLGTFTATNGLGSASKTLTVSGTNLAGSVDVVPPANFEVGLASNSFASTLSITNTGTLSNTAVLVRVSPSAPLGDLGTNNITVSSSGASNRLVQVTGTVINGSIGMSINGTNSVVVNEGDPALTLDVALSAPAPLGGTTVTLTSTDNDNSEITISPTSLVFAQGQTNATATVTPLADSVFDVDQTVVISAASTNWLSSGTVSVRVVNVDPAPPAFISLITTNTNAYVQDFNSLGTQTISNAFSATSGVQTSIGALGSTNLNGWYGAKVSGNGNSSTPLTADAGAGTSGTIYNYGSTNTNGGINLDRSLGSLASGSTVPAFGALIKNDTTNQMNSVKVTMTAERWRATTNVNTLAFAFGKVDDIDVTTANFLSTAVASQVPGLNVTVPASTNNGPVDGGAATNQFAFNDVLVPVNLAPGETAFIRWADTNEAGNDAGISIDNLSLSPSQELPSPDGEGTASLLNGDAGSYLFNSRIWARGASNQIVSATVTPTFDVSTIASVSLQVPVEWGSPSQSSVELDGGAAGATISVSGQVVTISSASITKANPGIIRIGGLTTPDSAAVGTGDGIYQFPVATAGAAGTLLPIAKTPAANVIVPIANVRDVDANFLPVDAGKVVAVEGVCTWGYLGGVYFQDDTGGMNAASNVALAFPLTESRKYAIVGTLGSNNGLIRITPASFSDVVDMGFGDAPTPIAVTLPQTPQEYEALEGELITIANLTRSASDTDAWGKPSTITLQDSSGNTIDLRIQGDFEGFAIEPGFPVTVVGILGQFDTSNPRDTGYQIMPRRMADLSFPPTLRLTWSINSATIDVREDGSGFDPSVTFLTLERIGNTSGAVDVALTASPSGRISNNGQVLPQTISLADGEASRVLGIAPINNSSVAPDTVITISASATGYTSTANSQLRILEDDTSVDTTPPVITMNGANPALVSWGAVYTDAGATAFDAGDNTNVPVASSGSVDTGVPGSYTINYSATDSRSNIATASRIVSVAMANGGTNVGANGLSDTLNYAFGATSPSAPVSSSLMPSNAIVGTNFVMTYVARTNANVTVVPFVNSALTNSAGWTTDGIIVSNIGTVATNGTVLDRREAKVPVVGNKFLRLRATVAP